MLRRTDKIKVISARLQLKGQKVSINEELNKNTIKLNKLGHTMEIFHDALNHFSESDVQCIPNYECDLI